MKKLLSILGLTLGLSILGFSQEYLREDIIKLTEMSYDKKYGYTQKKPIKVGSIDKETHFLNALRGPNGEKVMYQRSGSCCAFKSKQAAFGEGMLDIYQVWYEGGQPVTLYLNGYDYKNLACPIGFTFIVSDQVEPLKMLADSLITQVVACDKSRIYAVEDILLREAVGRLKKPDETPQYKGGVEELKQFFRQNPLTDKRAQNKVFKVAIGFKVNCNGEPGAYQIVTKGEGELKELASQVVEIVNKMPPNWTTATSKGRPVDCYQVLSFIVIQGSLEDVHYR